MELPQLLEEPVGIAPGRHACWTYRDAAEHAELGYAFLSEGLDRNELFVGSGPRAQLTAQHRELRVTGARRLAGRCPQLFGSTGTESA